MITREKIYLRLIVIDGKKYIVDQFARVVHGVIDITSTSSVDDIDTLNITFHEMHETGIPVIGGGHK